MEAQLDGINHLVTKIQVFMFTIEMLTTMFTILFITIIM